MRRMLLGSCALLIAGCLGAGSGQADNRPSTVEPAPTRLDYLWLASLADSGRLLAMAAYEPEPVGELK